MNANSVYRYAQTYQLQGLVGYLWAEQPGYWGLLTSAQFAGLRRELDQALCTDYRAIAHPEGPVHAVCENACYFKNKALAAWLAGQRLVQVFLPLYSPNLNPMERL